MGWFSSSESEKRASEVRAGTVAPSRAERQRCYESRDAYYACLDAHRIVDALKDDKQASRLCGGEGVAFERDCAQEWVTYFKKWRVQDIQKKARLAALEAEGAVKMDVTENFKPS